VVYFERIPRLESVFLNYHFTSFVQSVIGDLGIDGKVILELVGSCEHGNERSSSEEGGIFRHQLRLYYRLYESTP